MISTKQSERGQLLSDGKFDRQYFDNSYKIPPWSFFFILLLAWKETNEDVGDYSLQNSADASNQ